MAVRQAPRTMPGPQVESFNQASGLMPSPQAEDFNHASNVMEYAKKNFQSLAPPQGCGKRLIPGADAACSERLDNVQLDGEPPSISTRSPRLWTLWCFSDARTGILNPLSGACVSHATWADVTSRTV